MTEVYLSMGANGIMKTVGQKFPIFVIPAKAGIQFLAPPEDLDPRLRGGDGKKRRLGKY
jgi:hypothetical protein